MKGRVSEGVDFSLASPLQCSTCQKALGLHRHTLEFIQIQALLGSPTLIWKIGLHISFHNSPTELYRPSLGNFDQSSGRTYSLLRTPRPLSPFSWHVVPQHRAWFWATAQRWLIVLWVHRAALRGRIRGKFWHPLKTTLFSMGDWSEVLPLTGKSVVLATSI